MVLKRISGLAGLLIAAFVGLGLVSCGGGGGGGTMPAVNDPSTPIQVGQGGAFVAAKLDPGSIVTDSGTGKRIVAQQLIVRFRPNQSAADIDALIKQNNLVVVGQNTPAGLYQLQITDGRAVESVMASLQGSNRIDRISKNFVMNLDARPNDPAFKNPGDERAWALERIRALEAWALAPASGAPTVAVLDTGIDGSHPELAGRLLSGRSFVSDDVADKHGHGTFIAGLIAANVNNGEGGAGVCPSAVILPVKVCDSNGNCPLFAVLTGISYAAASGADVINISLGVDLPLGVGAEALFEAAAEHAAVTGALIVAAAGNQNRNASQYYPAALDGFTAVGATDAADARAGFSNYGDAVELAAPGVGVYSLDLDGRYRASNGTSAASALVSGAAAYLMAVKPGLDAHTVRNLLLDAADPVQTDRPLGAGRLNLLGAVSAGLDLNLPPRIVSLTAERQNVAPGRSVALSIQAEDPEGDAISIHWTADAGGLDSAVGDRVVWTAPDRDGVFRISVLVTDDRGGEARGGISIAVSSAALQSLALRPSDPEVSIGSRVQFSALGEYSDGTSRDLTNVVGWSVSDPDIAFVDGGGLFRGYIPGTVFVTAALDDKSARTRITLRSLGHVDQIVLGIAWDTYLEADTGNWPTYLHDRYRTRKIAETDSGDTIPTQLPFVLYWRMDLRKSVPDPIVSTPVVFDNSLWVTTGRSKAVRLDPSGAPGALYGSFEFRDSGAISNNAAPAPYPLGFGASKPGGSGPDTAGYYWTVPASGIVATDGAFDIKWHKHVSALAPGSLVPPTVAPMDPAVGGIGTDAVVISTFTDGLTAPRYLVALATDGFYAGSDFLVMAADPPVPVTAVAQGDDIQVVAPGDTPAEPYSTVILPGPNGVLDTPPTAESQRWVVDLFGDEPCTGAYPAQAHCNPTALGSNNRGWTAESGETLAGGVDVIWKCPINTIGVASPVVVQDGARWLVIYPDSSHISGRDAVSAFDLYGIYNGIDGDPDPNINKFGCDRVWRYFTGTDGDYANVASSAAVFNGRVFFGTQEGVVRAPDDWSDPAWGGNGRDSGYFHVIDLSTGNLNSRSVELDVCADSSPAVSNIGGGEWVYTGSGTLRGRRADDFANLFCIDFNIGVHDFGFHAWNSLAGTGTAPTWEFLLKSHRYKNFFMAPPLILDDDTVLAGAGDGVIYALKTTGRGAEDDDCGGSVCPGLDCSAFADQPTCEARTSCKWDATEGCYFRGPGHFRNPEDRCLAPNTDCTLDSRPTEADIRWAYSFGDYTFNPVNAGSSITTLGSVLGAPAAYDNLFFVPSANGFIYAFGETPELVGDFDVTAVGADFDVTWTNPPAPGPVAAGNYYFEGVMIVRNENGGQITTQLVPEQAVGSSGSADYEVGKCIDDPDLLCVGDGGTGVEQIVFTSSVDSGNPVGAPPVNSDWVTSSGAGAGQTWRDTGLTPGIQYCYRVYTVSRSIRLTTAGALAETRHNFSWMVEPDPIGGDDMCRTAGLPEPPTNVQAADREHDLGGVIILTWDKSLDDDGAGGVDDYVIQRGEVPGLQACNGGVTYDVTVDTVTADGSADYSYDDAATADGTYYCYAIYSSRGGVYSAVPGFAAGSARSEDNTPQAPANAAGADRTPDSGGVIELSWDRSPDDGFLMPVTEYYIYRTTTTVGTACDTLAYAATVDTAAADGSVSYQENDETAVDGTYYCYAIAAVDGLGIPTPLVSALAYIATAVTSEDQTPGAPLNTAAVDTPLDTGGSIDLSWDRSADDGIGMASVDEYRVYREESVSGGACDVGTVTYSTVIDTIAADGSASYQESDATAVDGTYYCYAIGAADLAGVPGPLVSVLGTIAEAVTSVDNTPAPPTGLSGQDTPLDAGGSIDLGWTLSADDGAGAVSVNTYNIYRTAVAGPGADCSAQMYGAAFDAVAAGTDAYTDATAADGDYYCYAVTALDTDAAPEIESDMAFTSPVSSADNTPGAPGALTAADAPDDDGGVIDLAWTASPDDPGDAFTWTEEYRIEFVNVGPGGAGADCSIQGGYAALAAVAAGQLTADHAPTVNHDYYCYRISAVNATADPDLESDWTYSSPATSFRNVAYPPVSVIVDQPACPDIRVSWTPPHDDDGFEVDQYHVYRSGAASPSFPGDFAGVRIEPATGAAGYEWLDLMPGDGNWSYTVVTEDYLGNLSEHFTPIPSFESTCHSYTGDPGAYDFGPQFNLFGSGGAPGENSLPMGAAIDDANGRIYVADTGNWRIQYYDLNTGAYLGAVGAPGNGGTLGEGNGGQWAAPKGLYFNNGLLWVANFANNRIERCNAALECTIDLWISGVQPQDIALDDAGANIFVVGDNNTIRRYAVGGVINRAYTAIATISGARGIEYFNNRVYVTSTASDAVLVRNVDAGFSAVAAWGSLGAAPGEFNDPWGIRRDVNDNTGTTIFLVSDSGNHRVQVLDETGTYLTEFGSYGICSGDPASCIGKLNQPAGLAIRAHIGKPVGDVYVVDRLNSRIALFEAPATP